MPEPDLFDLDDAFSSLARDIATVSSPRGAGQAVATARRRRRTTYAAVAAVAVLAVGGAAVAQGLGHDASSVGPSNQLPAPSPLDARALTTATAGWSSAWSDPDKSAQGIFTNLDFGCLDHIQGGTNVEPDSTGDLAAVNADSAVAYGNLADFGQKSAAAATTWDSLSTGLQQCSDATVSANRVWADGQALSFTVRSTKAGSVEQHVWLAREGNAVGLLFIADQPGAVPDAVDGRVMEAMVAGLQSPDSFHPLTSRSGSVSSSASAVPSTAFGQVSEADFTAALGTWPNGWQSRGTKSTGDSLPCAGDWTVGSSAGEGSSLGSNGDQEFYSFDSAENARASAQALAADLSSCASSPATVTTVTGTGSVPVTVAVGSGSDAQVTWIVQRGASVGYVSIPAGTTPPEQVSQAMGDALSQALAATATPAPPPVEQSSPALQQGAGTSSSSSTAPANAVPGS